MMSKIAHKIESNLDYQSLQRQAIRTAPDDTSEAICMSVAEIAYKFNVAAIIAFTESSPSKSIAASWIISGTNFNVEESNAK